MAAMRVPKPCDFFHASLIIAGRPVAAIASTRDKRHSTEITKTPQMPSAKAERSSVAGPNTVDNALSTPLINKAPNKPIPITISPMISCQTSIFPSRPPSLNKGRVRRSSSPSIMARYQVTVNGRKTIALTMLSTATAGLRGSIRSMPDSHAVIFSTTVMQ